MAPKRRIAWFSRIEENSNSLSAYCTRLLTPVLQSEFDIELFSDRSVAEAYGAPHDHYLNAARRHRERPFDLFFYNIEDGAAARFTRTHLGLIPGIIWIHDVFFTDTGAEAYHSSPWERTIDQYLNPGTPFHDRSIPIPLLWPRAYREIALAPLALYSSPVGHAEGLRLNLRRIEAYPGSHRHEIVPPPVEILPRPPASQPDSLTIASACRSTVGGQMHKVFQALLDLRTPWRLTWMIDPDEAAEAGAIVDEYGVRAHVRVVLGRCPSRWSELLDENTVALHLHNEPFHHVAPYLQMSLAAGRAAIACGPVGQREAPDDVLFRVEPGFFVTAQLREIFRSVLGGRVDDFGRAGRDYIRRTAEIEVVARKLSQIFNEYSPVFRDIYSRWGAVQHGGETGLAAAVAALTSPSLLTAVSPFDSLVRPFIDEVRRFQIKTAP